MSNVNDESPNSEITMHDKAVHGETVNSGVVYYNAVAGVDRPVCRWIAPEESNASVPQSWDTGRVPGLNDDVQFGSFGAGNCNLDVALNVGQIQFGGYAGTLRSVITDERRRLFVPQQVRDEVELPGEILINDNGTYSLDFNVASLPVYTPDVTVYFDPFHPLDGGVGQPAGGTNGETPDAPLQTWTRVFEKIQVAVDGGATKAKIVVMNHHKDGQLVVADRSYTGSVSPRGVAAPCDVLITTNDGERAYFDFSDAAYNWVDLGDGTYSVPRSNVDYVFDVRHYDDFDAPVLYAPVESADAVATTPGSWYTDGTTVWVNTIDGVSPVGQTWLRVNLLTVTSALCDAANHQVVYENIGFLCGNLFNSGGLCEGNTNHFVFNKCFFAFGTKQQGGLALQGQRKAWVFDCVAATCWKDGFNYHDNNNAALRSSAGQVIEVNCVAKNCGTDRMTINNNASTVHQGIGIVRLNCSGYDCYGPTFADVDGGVSFNVDLFAGVSLSSTSYQLHMDMSAWFVSCNVDDATDRTLYVDSRNQPAELADCNFQPVPNSVARDRIEVAKEINCDGFVSSATDLVTGVVDLAGLTVNNTGVRDFRGLNLTTCLTEGCDWKQLSGSPDAFNEWYGTGTFVRSFASLEFVANSYTRIMTTSRYATKMYINGTIAIAANESLQSRGGGQNSIDIGAAADIFGDDPTTFVRTENLNPTGNLAAVHDVGSFQLYDARLLPGGDYNANVQLQSILRSDVYSVALDFQSAPKFLGGVSFQNQLSNAASVWTINDIDASYHGDITTTTAGGKTVLLSPVLIVSDLAANVIDLTGIDSSQETEVQLTGSELVRVIANNSHVILDRALPADTVTLETSGTIRFHGIQNGTVELVGSGAFRLCDATSYSVLDVSDLTGTFDAGDYVVTIILMQTDIAYVAAQNSVIDDVGSGVVSGFVSSEMIQNVRDNSRGGYVI